MIRSLFRPLLSVVLPALLLTGCAAGLEPYKGRDYSSLPPMRLNVSAVLVDNAYQSPGVDPNIEHRLQPAPADVLRQAIAQHYPRLMTARTGAVESRFTIQEASVTETALELPKGTVERLTSRKPQYRYDGRMVVDATTSGRGARRTASAHVEVTRSLEVGRMSPAARLRQVQGMVNQMVDDALSQLDQQIEANFAGLGYGAGAQDATITPQPSGRWDHVMRWK